MVRTAGSIIGLHHLRRFREEMTGDVLHVRLFPKGELVMGSQVLEWNWMSPHYHRQAELLFNKSLELLDIRARRITDHQARRQVHNVRPVFQEFGWHVFHVASRTATTTGKAYDLQLFVGGIPGKSTPPFAQSAEAFTSPAIAVPGADDDPYSYCFDVRLRPMNKLS